MPRPAPTDRQTTLHNVPTHYIYLMAHGYRPAIGRLKA
jgi:hypothetical protein